jgi:hypothetical protein
MLLRYACCAGYSCFDTPRCGCSAERFIRMQPKGKRNARTYLVSSICRAVSPIAALHFSLLQGWVHEVGAQTRKKKANPQNRYGAIPPAKTVPIFSPIRFPLGYYPSFIHKLKGDAFACGLSFFNSRYRRVRADFWLWRRQ